MNKFKDKKYFVGIDISKDTLDLALLSESTYGSFDDFHTKNSIKGFDSIEKWLVSKNVRLTDCLFCMEHTGAYGLMLFAWMSYSSLDYVVEPGLQIKRSLGMTRGKNDKIDARRIADYAFTHRAKLSSYELPSQIILQIKQLLTYREQLVHLRTSLKNSLKSHQQYEKLSGMVSISTQILTQIKELDDKIKKIEDQIVLVISSDDQVKKNFELARSVKGIGLVIAAFMIMATNNFESFENSRKFACYVGIAPFEYSSGSSIKGKTMVSKLGNKTMKSLLSNGANSACRYDTEIRRYYQRKSNEGKDHKLIINAVCNKLVARVFAVVKRKSPYVEIYNHNF